MANLQSIIDSFKQVYHTSWKFSSYLALGCSALAMVGCAVSPSVVIPHERLAAIRTSDSAAQLFALKNRDGSPVFINIDNAEAYNAIGGDLALAMEYLTFMNQGGHNITGTDLLSLLNFQKLTDLKWNGGIIFGDDDTTWDYIRKGGTYRLAAELLGVHDSEGLSIIRNGWDMIPLASQRMTAGDVQSLADIPYCHDMPLFSLGFEISDYVSTGGTVDLARRIGLLQVDGCMHYDVSDLTNFAKLGGRAEFAEGMFSITQDGKPRYRPSEVNYLLGVINDDQLDQIEALGKVKEYSELEIHGIAVFSRIQDIAQVIVNRADTSRITRLAGINGADGTRVFNGYDIAWLTMKDGPSDATIERMVGLCDRHGSLPSGDAIFSLDEKGMDLDELIPYLEQGLSLKAAYLHRLYGIRDVQTNDTAKPDATILLSAFDHNRAFENRYMVDFFKGLNDAYDLRLRLICSEADMQDVDITGDELVIIGAHSNSYGMLINPFAKDDGSLDNKDDDFIRYINSMREDGTLFLLGCSTAKEMDDPGNFAEFVERNIGSRRFYASRDSMNGYSIKMHQPHPLEITIEGIPPELSHLAGVAAFAGHDLHEFTTDFTYTNKK